MKSHGIICYRRFGGCETIEDRGQKVGRTEGGSRNAAFDKLRRDKVGRNGKVQRVWRIGERTEGGKVRGWEGETVGGCAGSWEAKVKDNGERFRV